VLRYFQQSSPPSARVETPPQEVGVVLGECVVPVVVAVGHDGSRPALDWAAAEASARGRRLHVVHAERLGWVLDGSGLGPVADLCSPALTAEAVLQAAVERARWVAPDIEISEQVLLGRPVPLLVAQARHAALLVLGRSATARGRRPARSVGVAVARRAECPVAIVGPLPDRPAGRSRPRVVVGVDASGICAAALGLAFRAAGQRGVPLTAVHAWTPDVPADLEAVCGPYEVSEEHAAASVERVLEPWRNRFPDVPVETLLSLGDPAAALVRESEGAALVVLATRSRARVASFGSVSRSVSRRAACPVVVVRTAEARRPRERGGRATVRIPDPAGPGDARRETSPWE
jgi:nucleotide-binding universal stress UspA family protein